MTPVEMAFEASYSAPLVITSISIVILTCFISMSLLSIMRITRSDRKRFLWHLIASSIMGLGVWTMHFIGMLAFQMPLAVFFDPGLTFFSLFPAMVSSYFALRVLYPANGPTFRGVMAGGLCMGVGIGAMHYIGMAGMRMDGQMLYRPTIFVFSILVCIVMAMVALSTPHFMTFMHSSNPDNRNGLLSKTISASFMGLSISSLHYVAMNATVFMPDDSVSSSVVNAGGGLDEKLISIFAVIASVFILIVLSIVIFFKFRVLASERLAAASTRVAREVEDRFSKLVPRLPGMVYQLQMKPDGQMEFPYISDAAEEMSGFSIDEILDDASKIFTHIHEDDLEGMMQTIQDSANTLTAWRYEYRVVSENGERWLQGNSMPERLPDGSVLWSGFVTDITEAKVAEARINQLAFYDNLTGIPNRRLFEDRMEMAIAATSRSKSYSALLFLDLDNFKSLNDALGHSFGDELLRIIANKLSRRLREVDTVARLGGDEFVIIVQQLGVEGQLATERLAQIADELLQMLRQPVMLGGSQYRCSVSMGIALFSGSDHTVVELLRRADVAMYEAKSSGRSMYRFYDPTSQTAVAERFLLETDLSHAVENNELYLVFQKQHDQDGRCTGLEALVRWKHPERGLIPPDDFIPVAENNGMIIKLGQWVLEAACRQLAAWHSNPLTGTLTLSVNVSPREFHQADFVERVMDTLRHHEVRPEYLCLELTESLVLADLDDAITKIDVLRRHGIQLSMDDFGTGYSSMAYLSRLPFDEVKIDKSFVQKTEKDSTGNEWIIIETIINMSQRLGMRVVAEGVETRAQLDRLIQMGCDCCQGYYFGRPEVAGSLEFVSKPSTVD